VPRTSYYPSKSWRREKNAEFVRGDLGTALQQLKLESGEGLFVGGVKLPLALAELGLIDRYEFVVQASGPGADVGRRATQGGRRENR
jgi:hypothetical protein